MYRVQFLEAAYQTLIEYEIRRSFYLAGRRYTINTYAGIKENVRGYDLKVCALVPLFLQLKVANFHPVFSRATVVAARRSKGITDNPGCYSFSLHPDKKSKQYKQHNLLAALHSGGNYARYIAPLFHTAADLEHFKYSFRQPYWGPRAMGFWDGDWVDWRNYLSFDHSISILPHKHISDSTTTPHQYTYSSNNLVCFHSEVEQIADGTLLLASIGEELSRANSAKPMSLSAINAQILESLRTIEDDVRPMGLERKSGQQQENLFHYLARRLNRRYNIKCVLVAKRG
jgi:hypothetical protein